MEGVIDVQGVQHKKSIQMVTHLDINPVQQGLTSMNRREPMFSFGASRTRRRVQAVSFGPTNYEQCLCLSEWVSDTFAYRSHRKKPVSTLRVSTSLKRKAILRVSRTCVQNKTYKLKRSIINQTEEVILLKNDENSKSFIDDQVNLDCWVNI